MPTKISERDVCRQIIDCRRDALERVRELGASTVRYTRQYFTDDMLADGFITSKTTMDLKWRMLKVGGIVVERDKTTELLIPDLYLRAGVPCPVKGRTHTHTQTHTQTGEGGQ